MKYTRSTIVILLFIPTLFSCKKESVENQTSQKVDLKSGLTIDSTTKDIGVLRMFQLLDSIPLYRDKDSLSFFGAVILDYELPLLHFDPQELESYFQPLYFNYTGTYIELIETGKYNRELTFRVLEKDKDWMKIVFNEDKHLTCYVKNMVLLPNDITEKYLSDHAFRTWSEYFKGKHREVHNQKDSVVGIIVDGFNPAIFNDSLPLYDKQEGTLVPDSKKPQSFGFYCDTIVDDWMRVFTITGNHQKYWIKWKDNKDKILINYEENFGQE